MSSKNCEPWDERARFRYDDRRQHCHRRERNSLVNSLPLVCELDDFCQRDPTARLYLSEVMTIIVLFHASNYRNFKA
jgi:hypothetical protein